MEIKPGRYRTRSGKEAVITEIFENCAFGRYRADNHAFGWFGYAWALNGKADICHNNLDLVSEWEEPKPRLRVWRDNCSGKVRIMEEKPNYQFPGLKTIVIEDWQPVPELDALFEGGEK